MLITTHAGIVVNSDFIAYVLLRREEKEDMAEEAERSSPRFKVLLCFAHGDSIVAAIHLTSEQAAFLRQDIGHWWAEGNRAYGVSHAL